MPFWPGFRRFIKRVGNLNGQTHAVGLMLMARRGVRPIRPKTLSPRVSLRGNERGHNPGSENPLGEVKGRPRHR